MKSTNKLIFIWYLNLFKTNLSLCDDCKQTEIDSTDCPEADDTQAGLTRIFRKNLKYTAKQQSRNQRRLHTI